LIVLALALILRLAYLLEYYQSPYWEQLTVDNWYHHHWAESLAEGNILGDTTYFRAPLYVYSLGALYAVFGSSLWVGRLFGLFIGLGTVVMTYVLARRFFGYVTAAFAAALYAALPVVIYFESELLLDPLFTLLGLVAIWRFLTWYKSDLRRDLFVAGLAFGLAAICRPTILVVVSVAVLWIIVRRWRAGRRSTGTLFGSLALFATGLAVCIGPVFVRNLVVTGDPVLIASQGGINLYLGNNEDADGLSAVMPEPLGHNWQIRQITYVAESSKGRKLKPSEVSDYWSQRAIRWMATHPHEFLALLARKFIYQLGNREISNNRPLQAHFASLRLLRYNPLSFGLIFPLAVLGAVVMFRRSFEFRFVIMSMAALIAGIALFFFNSRFRLPLLPYYSLLATGGLAWLLTTWRKRPLLILAVLIPVVGLGWWSYHPPIAYPEGLSVQSLTSRGLYLYSRGEYDGALASFRQAAEVRPDLAEVNLNLGAVYVRLGEMDSARVYFTREAELHPQRHKTFQNLASLYLAEGRPEAARAMAALALSLAPYDISSHLVHMRALAADTLVDFDRVIKAVDEASAATDDDLKVLNEGAGILVNGGEIELALRYLHRAEVAKPPPIETDDQAFGVGFEHGRRQFEQTRAATYYLLGYCHARLGRLDQAVTFTERAISADSMLVEAYVNLYAGYLAQGRLMEADSVRAEAEERFPGRDLIQTVQP